MKNIDDVLIELIDLDLDYSANDEKHGYILRCKDEKDIEKTILKLQQLISKSDYKEAIIIDGRKYKDIKIKDLYYNDDVMHDKKTFQSVDVEKNNIICTAADKNKDSKAFIFTHLDECEDVMREKVVSFCYDGFPYKERFNSYLRIAVMLKTTYFVEQHLPFIYEVNFE